MVSGVRLLNEMSSLTSGVEGKTEGDICKLKIKMIYIFKKNIIWGYILVELFFSWVRHVFFLVLWRFCDGQRCD